MVPELDLGNLVRNFFRELRSEAMIGIKEHNLIKNYAYDFIRENYEIWKRGLYEKIRQNLDKDPIKTVSKIIVEKTAEDRESFNYKIRWISGGILYDKIEQEFPEEFKKIGRDNDLTRRAIIICLLARGFINEYLRKEGHSKNQSERAY